ncbi:MAG: L-seryl-tRNA(Sec) selenium transferase [Calditrichia bacterium]
MKPAFKNQLKLLPSIQEILDHPGLKDLQIANRYLKRLVQQIVEDFRLQILDGKFAGNASREMLTLEIISAVRKKVETLRQCYMKPVINATGIILHTNLGRAPLAEIARNHLKTVMENYCNLEIDLDTGKRGDRVDIVAEMLCLLTGAEDALVVNNNAAAVLLVLNSLCKGKEVPVSWGELVEIGGSFRMPEVMKAGGVKMVGIGTTNKTHLEDYREVISPRTGGILKVHTSNYRILGFTESVPISDLVDLAHTHDLPLIYDMGSGVIEDLQSWGYPHEPVAREYVEAGVDVITFSGDKILGGPQSGVIIGKKKYLQTIKKNHLLRALRCDKLTYALLDATLRLYLNPEKLPQELPVARMLNLPLDTLKDRANFLINGLSDLPLEADIAETYSQMGSGALPLEKIPSIAVRLKPHKISVSRLAKRLRGSSPPIIGYIENDRYLINLRTVREDELELILRAIRELF